MSDSENGVIREEEVKEKLILIRKEIISRKLKRTELKEKYGISLTALKDLNDMDPEEFNLFLEKIPYIKQNIQRGEMTGRIAAELACGTSIVFFVGKETCQGYSDNRRSKKTQFEELIKKIEVIWKENKLGENTENLAKKYNMDKKSLEQLLNSFNELLEKKRRYYGRLQDSNLRALKVKDLKEKWYLDDDTIAYIVEGKEIKKIKEEEGVSLDEP